MTEEEDFVLLLDSFLLEEDWRSPLEAGMTDEDDFAELLPDSLLLLDTLVSLLLDFGVTLDEDFAELLLASSQSSQMDEDESSSRGAKLLSSSPHPARNMPRTIDMETFRLHFATFMTRSFIFSLLVFSDGTTQPGY